MYESSVNDTAITKCNKCNLIINQGCHIFIYRMDNATHTSYIQNFKNTNVTPMEKEVLWGFCLPGGETSVCLCMIQKIEYKLLYCNYVYLKIIKIKTFKSTMDTDGMDTVELSKDCVKRPVNVTKEVTLYFCCHLLYFYGLRLPLNIKRETWQFRST